MKKKFMALLLAFVMCGILYVPSCATETSAEDWSLGESVVNELKEEFAEEFGFLEGKCGHSIDEIDQESFLEFADVVNRSLYDPNLNEKGYRFSALMDAIALAPTGAVPMNADFDETVYRSYGAITGEFLESAAVSVTMVQTGTRSFTVGGSIIPGITLSGSLGWSISYGLEGPARGTTLYNGMQATHNYACGVLFATVIKRETSLGPVYYLDNMNATDFVSCAAVTAQGTLYVDAGAPEYHSSSYWTGLNHFKQYLRSHPDMYLKGL